MPTYLTLRPLTEDEKRTIERRAQSRTEAARAVERAQIVWRAHRGERVRTIARALDITEATVRLWLKRLATSGVEGLTDAPRSGRPPVYRSDEVAEVVAASLTKPDELGLDFGSWTLDRLMTYLKAQKGLAIGRSRIATLLHQEGVRWRTEETWCGERVDPESSQQGGDRRPLRNTTSGLCRDLPR